MVYGKYKDARPISERMKCMLTTHTHTHTEGERERERGAIEETRALNNSLVLMPDNNL